MLRPLLLLFAGLGAAIIARAAWGYGAEDPVATLLVSLVGLGFAVGIFEQWRRLTGLTELSSQINGLPRPATEALLAAPPSRLANAFAAVRAGRPLPAPEPGVTPYLLGMLIMMGILGTFLGLVQTMAGARALMHDAPDTESLRAGLALPLSGLGRAFGTSVAGVGSSICLGLAALVVRRQATRLREITSSYAATELAAFTPQGRQIALLETLARQGSALPEAAGSLSQVSERLVRLESAVAQGARQTASQVAQSITQAAQAVGERFSADLSAALGRVEGVASTLAHTATEAAARVVGSHMGRLESTLAAHAQERAAMEKAHIDQRAAAEKAHLIAVGESLAAAVRQLGEVERARAEALHGSLQQQRDALVAEARRAAEREDERLTRVRLDAQALIGRLEALAVAQREAEAELLTRVGEEAGRQTEAIRSQAVDLLEEIRKLGHRVDALDAGRSEARAAAEAAAEARHLGMAERLAGMEAQRLARLEQTQGALVERLEVQERGREGAWQAVLTRLEAASESQSTRVQAELAQAREAWGALATRLAQSEEGRLARLEAEFGALRTGLVGLRDGLAEGERARADALRSDFATLLDAVRVSETRQVAAERDRIDLARAQVQAISGAAADGVSALQAPIQIIVDRLEGVVVTLAAAERDRAEALNDRLDAVVGQVQAITSRLEHGEQARVASFGAAVERLRAAAEVAASEVADRGAASQAVVARLDTLVGRLADAAEGQAQRLGAAEGEAQARLATLAEHLGERLAGTGMIVREAADLLRGGGAELTAVAEMFATAVDGYRETSERSLATLSRLEEALTRTDREAAGRVVGQYLDQTREIFGDAMRFQKELFNELRALRTGTP